jgi:hypothetical protein
MIKRDEEDRAKIAEEHASYKKEMQTAIFEIKD